MSVTEFAIALGANLPLGDELPMDTLNHALSRLNKHALFLFVKRSKWYKSVAFPPGSGPEFVNGAALFSTDLPPVKILSLLHETESALGRTREWRWGPRVCDLDLLFCGQDVLPDHATCADWIALDQGRAQTVTPPHLILPHPRMQERGFVLAPLAEIAPDWRHPVIGQTVAEMLAALPATDLQQLEPIED